MADLRIVDAPEIPTENITGEEKLPTGGNGNYSISLDSLADYTKTKKDLADNTSVDGKVNGVRQELNTHIEDLLNPHQVTKGQIGLGNVDNTADADKPVSNSTQAAIISAVAPKADKTYVDNRLTLKANKDDVYTKSETYTKQESSDLVSSSISTALTPVNTSLDLAKRGIANRYDSSFTYNSGERVVLANGDIVKSTVDGNTNDPNLNMNGWVNIGNAITVETIADMLSIQNPVDGMTANVKGYYTATNFALAQPFKGGDLFYYASSLATVNNSVTVFNGWVRDTSDKLLTTDDAGLLGDGADSNVTVRLQSIFSAADDGFTIQIIGKYTINRHIMAYNKKDLKIVGVNSDIQGDPDNWIWSTSHIVPDVPWYHPRGMLMAYECPNVHFNNLNIKGINRPNLHAGADPWQDGDCSIEAYLCDDAIFSYNICTNNYAWGIVSTTGKRNTAYGNRVSYCTHQSGINICSDSKSGVTRIYNNHVSECGLYGIEYENRNSYVIECYSNVVDKCYFGILALCDDFLIKGKVNNNKLDDCYVGLVPTGVRNKNNELVWSQNTVNNSAVGINAADASGVNVISNLFDGLFTKDTYLHISPSNFIAEVLTPNQFLTHRSLLTEFGVGVGSIYYVEEQQITVTGVATNTQPWKYGNMTPSDFLVITITESILNADYLFKHLKNKYNLGSLGLMGMQSRGGNKNNLFANNTVRNYQYGFLKGLANASTDYNETITANNFINCNVDVFSTELAMGLKYIDNNFTGNLGFHRDLVENGNVTLHPVISQKLGIARATTSEAVKSTAVYLPQKTRINAVSISVIGMNTTGKLRVTINGETLEAVSVGNNLLLYCNHLLNAGPHTVTISDSVGDLTYSDVFLGLLTT